MAVNDDAIELPRWLVWSQESFPYNLREVGAGSEQNWMQSRACPRASPSCFWCAPRVPTPEARLVFALLTRASDSHWLNEPRVHAFDTRPAFALTVRASPSHSGRAPRLHTRAGFISRSGFLMPASHLCSWCAPRNYTCDACLAFMLPMREA